MTHPLTVLVVEDEIALAVGLEDDLTMEGYRVVVSRDGLAASRLALEQSFDAIVLDVMLPGRDGFEVCRDIRRAGKRTPIILLTAKAQESDKILGLEIGADDYITKPFSPRELRARLKALLRRARGDLPEVYRFGDIEVEFAACQVRRSGRLLDFTTLEFKLLSFLIRRRGHVLTRGQVLDEIWGSATHVTDRVIDTHVANLRRKIEVDPARPQHLASVRGIGYRFDG
jgi:two-component system alkaline phosphatase synthesis response regulator PhoP